MRKLYVFIVVAGFVVISFIGGYFAARPAEVSFAAQSQFEQISDSLAGLWQKIGANIFPAGLDWSVGIGTKTPSEKLSVAGTIESMSGGFKFPDGTVQQTAQLVGPQGPQGQQGDPGPQGPPGPAGQQLHLYDANGQDLGILVDSEAGGSIGNTSNQLHRVFTSNGSIVYVGEYGIVGQPSQLARVLSLDGNQGHSVFFTDLNCTNNPFTPVPINKYLILKADLNIFRYFVSVGVTSSFTAGSQLTANGCQIGGGFYTQAFFLQETTLPFNEPLVWPLYIQ